MRKCGFYWVKDEWFGWELAKYVISERDETFGYWLRVGESIELSDNFWKRIDETLITRESPIPYIKKPKPK